MLPECGDRGATQRQRPHTLIFRFLRLPYVNVNEKLAVFDDRPLGSVAIDEIEQFSVAAAGLLEEAEADALAHLDFPVEHRRRLRTNNVQERDNREIKCRSRVVHVFPSVKSLIRLVGAVCCEIDEGWPSRCYMAPESPAVLNEGEKTPRTVEATTEDKERAIRLTAVAMESADAKRRAV